MAELGNLTAGILLPLRRMSTVKIRAGSLFRTSSARIRPTGAAFRDPGCGFPPPSTGHAVLHRMYTAQSGIPACAKPGSRCKVELELVYAIEEQ